LSTRLYRWAARCLVLSKKGKASGQAVHARSAREAASRSLKPAQTLLNQLQRLRIRASFRGSCPMIFAASGPARICCSPSARYGKTKRTGTQLAGKSGNLKRRKQRHRSKAMLSVPSFAPVQGLSVLFGPTCSISCVPRQLSQVLTMAYLGTTSLPSGQGLPDCKSGISGKSSLNAKVLCADIGKDIFDLAPRLAFSKRNSASWWCPILGLIRWVGHTCAGNHGSRPGTGPGSRDRM